MQRNIFAYTAPGGSYPEYVSINERGGGIVLTARSRGTPGATVDVPLPPEVVAEMASKLGTSPPLSDGQIKHMVDRFLSWRLPESFNPDGGISFEREFNTHTAHPMKNEPSGTNLLDATQADAMVRHMLEGLPAD